MDNIAGRIAEIEDFFLDFITQAVDLSSILTLCNMLGLEGDFTSTYKPTSLLNLVLLYGSLENNYTSDEVEYLHCGIDKAFFCSCCEGEPFSIIYTEIVAHEDDRRLIASAIIKILIKAFGANILLCIKHRNNIAFGVVSDAGEMAGYSLSCWYSPLDTSVLAEICMNCDGSIREIVYEIQQSSKDTATNSRFDAVTFDYKYLSTLNDIAEAYTLDLNKEINRYFNFYFEQESEYLPCADSRYINDILMHIGSEDISSYDYLEKAENAEYVSRIKMMNVDYEDVYVDVRENLAIIPKEAFDSAEKMLEFFKHQEDE